MQQPFVIDDDDRYSRLRLIAWWDQERLARARVLVVGAGALGNEVLKNLALVGLGNIYIIDFDRIESSNLTRSVLFRRRDCGQPKAEVAAMAIRDLNPDVNVKGFHANVMTDIGLGMFLDVDVVIACLDNREARLWVNRQCWKSGTPWIDGGIQEINGVVKTFVPPDSACYECAMTENDYRLINLRYSCPLLRQEDLQAGKVPTAPTISSIIAGLQTQEALKLIHQIPVESGQALVFNGIANRFYTTRFQRREDCLSHESHELPRALPLSSEHKASDLFKAVRNEFPSSATLQLQLDRDLVISVHCMACDWELKIMRPIQKVGIAEARCARCGQVAKPKLEHSIAADGPLVSEKLSALGIAPYDVVRVMSDDDQFVVLLAADREALFE